MTDEMLPHLDSTQIKKLLGKESFLHQFVTEMVSFRAIKRGLLVLKDYNKKMYRAL
ncbi:MAG: hypothetical protein WCJ39_01805 [bacterium]